MLFTSITFRVWWLVVRFLNWTLIQIANLVLTFPCLINFHYFWWLQIEMLILFNVYRTLIRDLRFDSYFLQVFFEVNELSCKPFGIATSFILLLHQWRNIFDVRALTLSSKWLLLHLLSVAVLLYSLSYLFQFLTFCFLCSLSHLT